MLLDQFAATWWAWVVFGFLLGILEILVPGFIFLGFAIGAVLTGVLVGAGVAPTGVTALLMVFAIVSVVSWIVLRRVVGVREGQVKIWDRDVNDKP